MIACACVVTKKCRQEFELLDYSIRQHHDVEWYISTDAETAEALGDDYNCQVLIDHDEGTHGSNDEAQNNQHMKMMMTKFDACRAALKEHDSVLFMDSDIFFLNGITENILELMNNPAIDALLCPHHTENKANEAKVGYYNAGFFIMRSKQLLEEWEALSKRYKELGMYYEQQPLEYASKTYTTVNLPMQYDIGWWRMNEKHTKNRLHAFGLTDDVVHFMGAPAVSVHAHTFKRLDYGNHATEMLLILTQLLKNSQDQKHKALLDKMAEICRSWQ